MPLKWLSKPLVSTLAGIALLWTAGPGLAAGTTPLALQQEVDINGQPIACQVNFYVAGTVATKQNIFADFALSQPLPNPLSCDQTGRVPMHWIADGLIHVQLIDASGSPLVDTTLQSLGPSSGGGGGGSTVDPTTILATGDEKLRYGTGSLSGFVRENGLTIGNATSGATERANADTQNLFIYLYNVDPNLVVSGGRTGNALNDYNANKQITLPDMRGRVAAGMDDMGNSAAGNLTGTYFGASTTLGGTGGLDHHTLSATEQASMSVSATGSVSASGPLNVGNLLQTNAVPVNSSATLGGPNTFALFPFNTVGTLVNPIASVTGSASVSGTATGGNVPHTIVQPTMVKTFYIKL